MAEFNAKPPSLSELDNLKIDILDKCIEKALGGIQLVLDRTDLANCAKMVLIKEIFGEALDVMGLKERVLPFVKAVDHAVEKAGEAYIVKQLDATKRGAESMMDQIRRIMEERGLGGEPPESE